jgi:hypothetical protein
MLAQSILVEIYQEHGPFVPALGDHVTMLDRLHFRCNNTNHAKQIQGWIDQFRAPLISKDVEKAEAEAITRIKLVRNDFFNLLDGWGIALPGIDPCL